MRGLKLAVAGAVIGGVTVAPFTGAWIETAETACTNEKDLGRTLHGWVD